MSEGGNFLGVGLGGVCAPPGLDNGGVCAPHGLHCDGEVGGVCASHGLLFVPRHEGGQGEQDLGLRAEGLGVLLKHGQQLGLGEDGALHRGFGRHLQPAGHDKLAGRDEDVGCGGYFFETSLAVFKSGRRRKEWGEG